MKPSNDLYTLLQHSILHQDPIIEPYLHNPPQGSLADRIAIYTNGFYSRLEEALLSDYQTLAVLMGKDEFSQLCKKYVTTYPSQSFSLNFLGQNISKFLMETAPYDKKPYLSEIAFYEWAEAQAHTSTDATIVTTTELQQLPPDQWPDLKFYLHPSCHLLTMYWNSLALIKASRATYKHLPRPKKMAGSQSVMVWRRQQQIRYYVLNSLELNMLQAMKNNASFIEICEQLSTEMKDDEVANYLVKKLYVWLQEEWLVHKET